MKVILHLNLSDSVNLPKITVDDENLYEEKKIIIKIKRLIKLLEIVIIIIIINGMIITAFENWNDVVVKREG